MNTNFSKFHLWKMAQNPQKWKFKASKSVKMAIFEAVNWLKTNNFWATVLSTQNVISRKIWVTEKFFNFQTVSWVLLPKGILASDNINKHGVAFPKFFGKFFDFMPTTSKSDRWSLQAQKILLLLWISRKILKVYCCWVLKLFVCFD